MEVTCPKCQTVTAADVAFEATHFSCPSCRSIFTFKDGKPEFQRAFYDKSVVDVMSVGQKGVLDGIEYAVTGIVVKKVYGAYYWREYILVDHDGNFRYLSESEGHWILLREIDDAPKNPNHKKIVEYEDKQFNIYDYTKADLVTAMGFFDFALQDEKIPMDDYIHPPYMLSYETMNGIRSAFIGEHISKRKVSKAFKNANMPYQSGMGVVSPPFADIRNMAIVFSFLAILLFITHFFIYKDQSRKVVLNAGLPFTSQSYVSPSFELKGGAAPLTITVYSDIDNSWASADIALVNETTGDEEYASKDIEYYHGYTDGENWSEGGTSNRFNICGVAAGKYHIVVTSQKDPGSTASIITVKAVWNETSYKNVFMLVILMAIILFGCYKYNEYREKQRWADSDHSPLDS